MKKNNVLTLKKKATKKNKKNKKKTDDVPQKTDYADDLVLLANTPAQAATLLHDL